MKKAKLIGNADIKDITYGAHHYHRMLNKDENIGPNGKNLTIMVLSCNRSEATITLINSIEKEIPNFEGEILIIDNNSSTKEKEILKKRLKKLKMKNSFIELEKNYGVAGGRNRGVEYVKTDWFMSLDNDIYFTVNPLKEIKDTISILGCHFLNIPLLDETKEKLFVNGGHIFLYNVYNEKADRQDIHFGGGSLFECNEAKSGDIYEPSFGTFLFGGASILKKETFIRLGKFDENMFVGFEDYDFSIEIFQNGLKIGNLGLICAVHNHKMPEKKDDIEYEKIRFSNEKLREAGLYFEEKRNFKVWNKETEEWIKEKHKQMNIK